MGGSVTSPQDWAIRQPQSSISLCTASRRSGFVCRVCRPAGVKVLSNAYAGIAPSFSCVVHGILHTVCRWALHQSSPSRPTPERAARSLRTFRVWRDAVPRGWGEVEHILRKHGNEIVDNVPHRYDPGRPALVIDQGNVLVVPHTHLVERVSEFIIHMQAIRIGCHERPNLQVIYI